MEDQQKYNEKCPDEKWSKKKWHGHHQSGAMGGCLYFFAFVGAAVYYIQQSDGFWMGVLGFLKACVWPAMLIYKVFILLGM